MTPTLAQLEADPRYARGIPLRMCNGGIRAFAMVDAEDLAEVSQSRWSFFAKKYVGRKAPRGNGTILLHRQLLGLSPGDGFAGDHRNGDKLDNRRANLRVTTAAGNSQNRPRGANRMSEPTSRFRGVCWARREARWISTATIHGRRKFLGYHASELDAALAAEAFRSEHMPFSQPDPELANALAESRAA